MVICVPVMPDGSVGHSWGRAARVAVMRVDAGDVVSSVEHDVGWDAAHDAGTEGSHHARIARFLQDQGIEMVVSGHMGQPMVRMLEGMGLHVRLGATGDARAAVVAAVQPA